MVNQIFTEDRKETQRKVKRARAKSRQTVMEQLKQSLTGLFMSYIYIQLIWVSLSLFHA